jgi:hypothetical protein
LGLLFILIYWFVWWLMQPPIPPPAPVQFKTINVRHYGAEVIEIGQHEMKALTWDGKKKQYRVMWKRRG